MLFFKLKGKAFIGFLSRDRSALESSILMTIISIVSKIIGYGRMVLVAVLFGTSAGMDAYYVAFGALALIVGTAQSTLESAVLPLLARAEIEGRDEALLASTFWIAFIVTVPILIFLGFFASSYVNLFALNFDSDRLRISSVMLILLLPWGAVTVFNSFLVLWATHRGRYTLFAIATAPFNLLIIPMIVFFSYFWGNYSIVIAQSLALIVCSCFFWNLMQGIPLQCKIIPWDLLRKVGNDSLMCLALVGAGALYQATDRFFASGLTVGNVSAISYSDIVFGLPLSFALNPLLIYLKKSSQSMIELGDAKKQLKGALFIAWNYFMPLGLIMVVLSQPLIKIIFNYGAFDSHATKLTAACLSASAVALPFCLWQNVILRYMQSIGKLEIAVRWGYLFVFLNVFLDWILAPVFGAPGICFATSLVWFFSSVFYINKLAPGLLSEIFAPILVQTLILLLWIIPLYLFINNFFVLFAVSPFAMFLHLLICERLGYSCHLPENWKIRAIFKSILIKKRG